MNSKFTIAMWALIVSFGVYHSKSWVAEGEQGRSYYLKYCGSCHGLERKGDGVVSRSLKVKPPDLTLLQKKHKGTFPLEKVIASIDGKLHIEAHGESRMPVWGEIFEKQALTQNDPAATSAAKVKAIAEYVSMIQR